MTVEAIDPDAHLEGWPDELEVEPVELPEPVWTRASERAPKVKVTPEQRKKRRRR